MDADTDDQPATGRHAHCPARWQRAVRRGRRPARQPARDGRAVPAGFRASASAHPDADTSTAHTDTDPAIPATDRANRAAPADAGANSSAIANAAADRFATGPNTCRHAAYGGDTGTPGYTDPASSSAHAPAARGADAGTPGWPAGNADARAVSARSAGWAMPARSPVGTSSWGVEPYGPWRPPCARTAT